MNDSFGKRVGGVGLWRTVAGVALSLVAPLAAQVQWNSFGRTPFGFQGGDIATGDVDGDGDLDVVLGIPNQPNKLFLNDGRGRFEEALGNLPGTVADTLDVKLGDLDGDGDLDLVASPEGMFENDGTGRFAFLERLDLSQRPIVKLGDMDGDGDLDVVTGTSLHIFLLRNDGHGFFSESRLVAIGFLGTGPPQFPLPFPLEDEEGRFALSDVDGDEVLDLVVAGAAKDGPPGYFPIPDSPGTIYLNDGAGNLTETQVLNAGIGGEPAREGRLAVGDLDGEGAPEVVLLSNYQRCPFGCSVSETRVWKREGSSWRSIQTLPGHDRFLLGDVDADGDLDLLAEGAWYEPNALYLNDGTGTFAPVEGVLKGDAPFATLLALVDLDHDGDEDLVTRDVQTTLHRNLLWQLNSIGSPRLGRVFDLQIYGRRGAAGAEADLALPFLSLAPVSVPVPPFGTLGIQLQGAIPLDPVLVSQPSGLGIAQVRIPDVPALEGLDLYVQALLLQDGKAHLTNTTVDRIVR